jgi:hypothetical protein
MPVDVDQFEAAKRKRKENKTDQLNADDLIQPITVKITDANNGNGEQLLALSISGGHKPYKPCHTMIKLLSFAWGNDDPNTWVGKSLRLYCDQEVINRGEVVGGIRVSHVSHIDGPKTRKLNEKRGQRKAWTVFPIDTEPPQPKPDIPPAIADVLNEWRPKLTSESKALVAMAKRIAAVRTPEQSLSIEIDLDAMEDNDARILLTDFLKAILAVLV